MRLLSVFYLKCFSPAYFYTPYLGCLYAGPKSGPEFALTVPLTLVLNTGPHALNSGCASPHPSNKLDMRIKRRVVLSVRPASACRR